MKPHLLIMAAGTGGHIMPGLAIAQEAKARGWNVSWLGTQVGMENRWVPAENIPLNTITFRGLRGKGPTHALKGIWHFMAGMISCIRMIQKEKVDVVIGMGGYICVPGGLAAWIQKKPLLLVNADAALLMSNRLLQPFARCTAMGFTTQNKGLDHKFIVTGNPVRHSIETIVPPTQRFASRSGPLRILIMGGSLGARILNQIMPPTLALLPEENRPQVLHQTGLGHDHSVTELYEELNLLPWVRVQPFIEDVALALSQCDVVICRAGAITVSELCSAGVPSVLVPLVLGTTSHQTHNAQFMAQHGAAIHLDQNQLTPHALAQMIQTFNRNDLLTMALRAHQLAQPHSSEKIVDVVAQWMGVSV